MLQRRPLITGAATTLLAPSSGWAAETGEIRVGNTMPYSGPSASQGMIGKAEAAYFRMFNEQGGLDGRKINFMSLDDQATPSKTLELTKRLVERDKVTLMFSMYGTAPNNAVWKYLNQKKTPHLFVSSGSSQWSDYQAHPWTMGWRPDYRMEARVFGKYIQRAKPNGTIGIIYQASEVGLDYIDGIRDVIGAAAMKRVPVLLLESADATVDQLVARLKDAKVDVLITATSPRFASLVLNKLHTLDWKPLHIMSSMSASPGSVLMPAGPDRAAGIVSAAFAKDPAARDWDDDAGMKEYRSFVAKYMPNDDPRNPLAAQGWAVSQTLVHVLRACGRNVSPENIMRQAAGLNNLANPMLLPGITQSTSKTNYSPLRQMQMVWWNGKAWDRFGDIVDASKG